MKILADVLIYIGSFGFLGWITHLSVKAGLNNLSRKNKIGLSLLWLALIFNIIYTGILGWNFTPASSLESLLDGITFVIYIVGIILMNSEVVKRSGFDGNK